MASEEHAGQQFRALYHATYHAFSPGDHVVPGAKVADDRRPSGTYPASERWRQSRVWMAADAGNAGAWYGHDDPDVRVFEVEPAGPVRAQRPGKWDTQVAADHADDQFIGKAAVVRREVPRSEWNDFG